MTLRRHARTVVAIVMGVVLGTGVVVGAEALSEDPVGQPKSAPTPAPAVTTSKVKEPVRTTMLVWMPGGLPRGAERSIEKMPGVQDATTIEAGLEWIQRSTRSDGAMSRAPKGFSIPLEVAFIDPRGYSRFVSPGERAAVASLDPIEMVIPRTEEGLRGGGTGQVIVTDNGARTVTAVISDRATNGYEALVAGPSPAGWFGGDRFVLAHLSPDAERRRIERRITDRFDDQGTLRVRLQGEAPYLRYGDAVLPQLIIKQAFGEFAARATGDGFVEVDPQWRVENIRTGKVPILGDVACHRRLFGQLRAALTQVRAEQLGFLVDPSDYGGCYSARFVSTSSSQRLSHHSWGIAIDINVAENSFGTKADQDPRLVEIFESHGFTWGGRWLIPDGMHFEWVSFSGD